ncbi:CORIN [Mytilus coruscus]|uniref:CORIN n=1 Tax=Mytilus coruscus TaxID=42192 RepID=A0A6J8ANI5_MYTCO|nr:CORIN [Mytilus coruscus]
MTDKTGQEFRTPKKLSFSGQQDVRQRKYNVSHDATPSPTDSENGNYYRNLAFSASSNDYVPTNRTSPLKLNFDEDNNDDVFVISHADSAVYSDKSKAKRVESARTSSDENPSELKIRKICLIIIFIVIILGLIAGIAVIVVFYVLNLGNIVLDSSVRLKNDWSNQLYNSSSDFYKTLSQNYTQEIDNLMRNSNVSQFYLGVRVLDFSPGSIFVHSEISFRPDVFSETLFYDVFDLSNGIEDIIRLESSLGKTSLLIDTRQIYVSGKCVSLDFNVCSSFYNATSFPNFYNHKSYEEAVTYFQNDLQPVIDSGCSNLASLFLCGLNFPSCHKARQLLPCRSVCQQYNTDCSVSIDCSQFEDSTDRNLCLTMPTTTTTESTTIMTTMEASTSIETTTMTTEQTTYMTTEATSTTMTTDSSTTTMTTTEPTTTVTTEPVSTTPKALCEDVQAVQCQQVGINQTTFPNHFTQESQDLALQVFNYYINDTCSENATLFYCSALFPRCDKGALEKPCKDLCLAAMRECGDNALQLFTMDDCNQFNDRYCVHPLPSPPTPTETSTQPLETTTSTEKCEAVQADVCHPVGLTKTAFPNFYSQFSQGEALKTFNSYINDSCSNNATLFYCSSFFPRCDQGHKQFPCKNLCLAASKECGSAVRLASEESCNSGFYPEQDCVEPLPSAPQPSITPSTTPSTTTVTTELCEKVEYTECQQFSNSTIFPGMWGSENHALAVQVMSAYQGIIDSQCSSHSLKYFCSGAFHHCDKGVKKLPCRRLCEVVVKECQFEGIFNCTNLPETDCVPMDSDTQLPKKCEAVQADVCHPVGLTTTAFPNFYSQFSQGEALKTFNSYINDSCSDNATLFYCSSFFPRCYQGHTQFPCKNLCLAASKECGSAVRLASEESCNSGFHPEQDCVEPLTSAPQPSITPSTTPSTTTVTTDLCEKVEYKECQQFSNSTIFPGMWGSKNHALAVQVMSAYQGIIDSQCSSHSLKYFCSGAFHHCDKGVKKLPCRRLCEVVVKECQFEGIFNCTNLPETDCVPMDSDTQLPNCTLTGQETCPDGSCIMSEWLCDGEADCSDNWDEQNCSKCSAEQFTCQDGTCVPGTERCNALAACPDKSDERDCVHLSEIVPGVLMVNYKDYHIPICYDSWSDSFGFYTCSYLLGNHNFTKSSDVVFPARTYAHLVPQEEAGAYHSQFGYLVAKSTCKDNKVVSLQCVPKGCGQKFVGGGMVGYIVNGYTAAPGAWPWQAALELQVTGTTKFRKHLCGGVLISPNFVLTATHCVNEYSDVKLYRVILGTSNRNNLGTSSKTYEVERIDRFDDKWYSFQSGDITLLQLKQTVEYTPYIQPICLPSESDETPTTAICYGTGWGQLTGEKDGEFADDLQELKLKLWKTEKCNGSQAWNGKIAHGYVCGGYESGIRSMCSGDSGGPMVCQDNQNNWYLKGIASYVANFCNMTNRPNVFTDVQTYLGWINNNTRCIFKCKNGKCIYDSQLLCNREDNCGDNSDEIDQCDVSVNCTFDDKFMCGYGIEGFQQQRQILNSQDPTTLPSFDHTFGRYPGYYMAGKTPSSSGSEARLTSPKFTIQGSTCIRFFYNLRGDLNAGLKVRMYTFSTAGDRLQGQQVWASGEGIFKDKWRLGYIDLSIGTYEIVFIANDGMQVAVDDVSLHNGMCSQSVCLTNEYKCTSEAGSDACISFNSLCDVVKDCHSDELNCNHSERHYSCQFENSVLCDIQQETFDNGEWLIINQTYTRSFVLYSESFPDHTTATDQGYMLFLMTNLLMRSEFVAMTLDVSLQDKDFCLTFWYRSKTEATFKIDILNSTTVMTLMSFTDRTTKNWTKAQMQLPPMNDAVIKFTVIRETPVIHSYYKPHLALDDIQISNGLCPDYGCPENWSKCGNENYCYSPEEKCDRKLQCSDESDEINCNCTNTEFRCGSGRCIPLSQKCDRIGQCLDGSDEGAICDPMNAVSCIFESPYLCGYTVLSNSSLTNEYKWLWTSGETPSFYTGPKTDHTTGTTLGHYMYAEGNDGNQGDQARMASIYFLTTTNQSLTFFFHMFFQQFTKTGGLQIATKEDGSNIENAIWFHNESSGEPWISGCMAYVEHIANQMLLWLTTHRNNAIYRLCFRRVYM